MKSQRVKIRGPKKWNLPKIHHSIAAILFLSGLLQLLVVCKTQASTKNNNVIINIDRGSSRDEQPVGQLVEFLANQRDQNADYRLLFDSEPDYTDYRAYVMALDQPASGQSSNKLTISDADSQRSHDDQMLVDQANGGANRSQAASSKAGKAFGKPAKRSINYWRLLWFVLPVGAAFGNLLVILAVYKERSLQSVTNYFIVSLAFADLFVGLIVMPFAVYVLVNGVWELGDTICDIFIAVDVTSSTASILNLVAISIDRYRAIAHPIVYTASSSNLISLVTIAGVWTISCSVGAPIILGLNTSPGRDSHHCILYNSTFIFWSSLASFYIPCIAMIALYWRIFSAIRSRTKLALRASAQTTTSSGHNQQLQPPTGHLNPVQPSPSELLTVEPTTFAPSDKSLEDRVGQSISQTPLAAQVGKRADQSPSHRSLAIGRVPAARNQPARGLAWLPLPACQCSRGRPAGDHHENGPLVTISHLSRASPPTRCRQVVLSKMAACQPTSAQGDFLDQESCRPQGSLAAALCSLLLPARDFRQYMPTAANHWSFMEWLEVVGSSQPLETSQEKGTVEPEAGRRMRLASTGEQASRSFPANLQPLRLDVVGSSTPEAQIHANHWSQAWVLALSFECASAKTRAASSSITSDSCCCCGSLHSASGAPTRAPSSVSLAEPIEGRTCLLVSTLFSASDRPISRLMATNSLSSSCACMVYVWSGDQPFDSAHPIRRQIRLATVNRKLCDHCADSCLLASFTKVQLAPLDTDLAKCSLESECHLLRWLNGTQEIQTDPCSSSSSSSSTSLIARSPGLSSRSTSSGSSSELRCSLEVTGSCPQAGCCLDSLLADDCSGCADARRCPFSRCNQSPADRMLNKLASNVELAEDRSLAGKHQTTDQPKSPDASNSVVKSTSLSEDQSAKQTQPDISVRNSVATRPNDSQKPATKPTAIRGSANDKISRAKVKGQGGSGHRRERNASRRERKATKTLAIVLGVFLICWTPFFTCNIIDGICIQLDIDCRPGIMVYTITSWLGYINSCVNPVIYTIFNLEFRRAFKKILTTRPTATCCSSY